MPESSKDIFNLLFEFVTGLFAEVSIIFLLVGLVLFLVGLFVLVVMLYSRTAGQHVQGKVIGAIYKERIKQKEVKGELKTKIKKSLYPVYEYTLADGTTHRNKGSEGGDIVKKYKTGQQVDLLVCPRKNAHDVYDANSKGGWIIGLVLIAVGFGFMMLAGNIYTSLSVSTFTLVIVLLSLAIRALTGRKKRKKKKPESAQEQNELDLSEVRPVEEVLGKL